MQIKVTNSRTGVTYQYDVEQMLLSLLNEPTQRKLRVYFNCTIWGSGEVITKTWDDRPLELDLNNPSPRLAQVLALLKAEIEEAQQVRAQKMLNIPGGTPSPAPTPTPSPAPVPTPTPPNRPT